MGSSPESAEFDFDVCVVGGCGHVGLPLAIVMAHRELRVAIDDIDTNAVETVRSGRMPFMEDKAEPMLAEVINENLVVDNDPTLISRSRIVVVIIGTPVDEHLNPTFHKIHRFFVGMMPYLVDGQCVILRSTVYPGTTEKVDALVRASGRKVHVAFCPERIAQGSAMRELVELPQIVAGCDDEATRMATDLFSRIAPSIIPMQPIEAELTKIFANVWRYIQFATANQFFMIATDYGLDFYRIHDALTRDYPRMAGLPKSGFAAGPCLFKDTMQLAAATESRFLLGHAAMLINEGLPDFVVQQMKSRYPLGDLTVGILGMAFKGDIDDARESLSYKLRKILEYEAAEVLCTDPYVDDPRLISLDEAVARSDVLVLGAPHSDYRALVIPDDKPVVDIWNFFGKRSAAYVKILVTGSAGFIAGYLIEELLANGYEVVGLDNYSKYGPVERAFDTNPNYTGVKGDAKDVALLKELLSGCDHLLAGAAIIGGISLLHELAYDLLSENERITAATFDAAIWAHRNANLRKITVVSSSMVYESTSTYPTPEGEQRHCPPPQSTYGFQKLATEYFAQGAWEQYQLPYTIVRPFNCIGVGEKRALCDREIMSGNVRLAMSHVVPDLVQKVLKGQDPLHILGDGNQVRHYTYGGDLARGIRLAIESDAAHNEDFNLSTATSTSVHELAELIWSKVKGDVPLRIVSDKPFLYDVQRRVPDVQKAMDALGFKATTSLDEALDEIIPWIESQIELGGI